MLVKQVLIAAAVAFALSGGAAFAQQGGAGGAAGGGAAGESASGGGNPAVANSTTTSAGTPTQGMAAQPRNTQRLAGTSTDNGNQAGTTMSGTPGASGTSNR